MNVCAKWCGRVLAVVVALIFAVGISRAQETAKQHVVSIEDLSNARAQRTETRQADESALRNLFSSEQAQRALKSAGVDYSKVDEAVGQLSDEDLGKLAARSRQLQGDFAAGKAGGLSDRDLLVIIIIAVLVIALIAVLR